ncbi:GTP-binding protein Obg/CgtA isoform X2 [Wolffia australiana]
MPAIWIARMLRRRAILQALVGNRSHGSSSSRSFGKGGKLAPLQERRMVDRLRIWAKGGEGGSGCQSTRRSRTDRHGRPDGGNGGRGGDVILECSASVWDLSNLQHHLNGKRGGNGTSKNMVGTRGADKVVQVPVGTVIHSVEGEAPVFLPENRGLQPWEITTEEPNPEEREEGETEIELTRPGQRVVVARGGDGGAGSFSEKAAAAGGGGGTEATVVLELKSIADVGLVGLPNAGKSTLLGSMSRAKPAVGDYPFTTLRPNIGSVELEELVSVRVADIPGIIRGAHQNRGLGHAFLRHIERTRVLAYVVDVAAAPPWEQLRDLVEELERHREGMAARPSVVVANKMDLEGAEEAVAELRRRVRGVAVVPVSAVLGEGVKQLKTEIRRLVDGGGAATALTLENITVD